VHALTCILLLAYIFTLTVIRLSSWSCLISDNKFPNYEELKFCLKLLTEHVETVYTPVQITCFLSCYMLVP